MVTTMITIVVGTIFHTITIIMVAGTTIIDITPWRKDIDTSFHNGNKGFIWKNQMERW